MQQAKTSAFVSIGPSAMLAPVPAVVLSCRGKEDRPANLITVAWAGTVCSDPPMLSVSIRPERASYAMIEESGAFCLNLIGRSLCRAADFCGVKSGRDVDKFAALGLHELSLEGFPAPAIAEAPAFLLCRVQQRIPLGSHVLFLSRIEDVRVSEALLDEKGALHLERAELVAYAHGEYYPLERRPEGFFGYSVAREDVLRRRLPREEDKKKKSAERRRKG